MKYKSVALLTALTLTLTASAASAHTFVGGHEKEIQKIVAKIEKKIGPLNEELTFYNENTREDGYKRLVELGVNPDIAKPLVQTSTGLTMPQAKDKWVVIIRENSESDFFLKFALCHEIIHRYQVNSYPIERIYDRNLIEGEANVLAAKIMGVNIKSEENWQELKNFLQPLQSDSGPASLCQRILQNKQRYAVLQNQPPERIQKQPDCKTKYILNYSNWSFYSSKNRRSLLALRFLLESYLFYFYMHSNFFSIFRSHKLE